MLEYFPVRFCVILFVSAVALKAAELKPQEVEFFEAKIRPVLAQDCYECHRTGGKKEGGLALDYRGAMEEGGETDDLYDFKNPRESYLIRVIDHLEKDTEMPKEGAKLEEEVIEDFVKWIEMGAPDPRDDPPSDEEVAQEGSWDKVRDRRKGWWSFQPVKEVHPPEGEGAAIDRFIEAGLVKKGLIPEGRAEDEVLIRRLSFALRGLPPSAEEVAAFEAASNWEQLVDQFLASSQYGERWARHWMDWLRYADSHGSEGDPAIPNAWRYRDYLIRSLNADIPYNQLVREHLAGDLLENPRIVDGLNESAHGPGHLRMVFHGFTPTDALDELVRFTDDQVNVVSKAFQGLTVSCARCHNHKFDAISQEDYYAWFGIFASTKPGSVRVDVPKDETAVRAEMASLKNEIRAVLVKAWTGSTEVEQKLTQLNGERVEKAVGGSFLSILKKGRAGIEKVMGSKKGWDRSGVKVLWEGEKLLTWTSQGEHASGLGKAGAFAISSDPAKVIEGIFPAGRYSNLISDKDRGIFISPRTPLDGDYELWWELAGEGDAVARYAVQNYPSSGTVYPMTTLKGGHWRGVRQNLDYWAGDMIHLELTTGQDQALLRRGGSRSWIGIRRAMLLEKGTPSPPPLSEEAEVLLAKSYREGDTIEKLIARVAKEAAQDWGSESLSDAQAFLLDSLVREGALANTAADELAKGYRDLEANLATPIRAPGVWEADSFDQPFYTRGDPKKPAHLVRRRFLEVFDDTPYETKLSGRLELADDLADESNPFTARVLVNRVWHHLFGRGLVSTVDNFGRLGEKPTHPELLDDLAKRFMDEGWSLKKLIKEVVMSDTWQRKSLPSKEATEIDPDNLFLSHFRLQRLDAEAIRDSLLVVAGALEDRLYGGPVEGRSGRRSVYVRNQRNRLDPFLTTFNAPVPLGGKGRRDLTNVPAQSLTLLNSERIMQLAERWAEQLEGKPAEDAVREMFAKAFAREASDEEVKGAIAFMNSMDARRTEQVRRRRQWNEKIASLEGDVADLEGMARARVEATRGEPKDQAKGPQAWASWDFDKDANDQHGTLHGTLHGGAVIEDGVLVTGRKNGYVSTKPLGKSLAEKTMQVLVELDDLNQRGGGAITVQTSNGHVFDSIVYGEQESGRWISGSDRFVRTESFKGLKETERSPVWMTTVYLKDGTILAYRNGKPYGNSYRKASLIEYGSDAVVLFGNRHGPPSGGRLLKARIHEARLYDRALTPEEVVLSTGHVPGVGEEEMLAAMSDPERARWYSLKLALKRERAVGENLQQGSRLGTGLGDLAHALFNMKEFIYLR